LNLSKTSRLITVRFVDFIKEIQRERRL